MQFYSNHIIDIHGMIRCFQTWFAFACCCVSSHFTSSFHALPNLLFQVLQCITSVVFMKPVQLYKIMLEIPWLCTLWPPGRISHASAKPNLIPFFIVVVILIFMCCSEDSIKSCFYFHSYKTSAIRYYL